MIQIKYNPENKLTALSIEVKILWIAVLAAWILLINSGSGQIILLLFIFSVVFYGGLKLKNIINYFRIFIPFCMIIFLLHLFYQPGDILFKLWFLKATDNGLRAGLFNNLRFINFILTMICFISFISPVEFAAKLSSGFGLARKRIFRELALVFFIALRFFPVLTNERKIVKMAMIARGADFKGKFTNRIKMETRLMLPLLTRVLRQSDDVAVAIALKSHKGNFFAGRITALKGVDYLLIAIALICTIILILL